MRSAFADEFHLAFYVRRLSRRARWMRAAASLVQSDNVFTGRSNLLARSLRDPSLHWVSAQGADVASLGLSWTSDTSDLI